MTRLLATCARVLQVPVVVSLAVLVVLRLVAALVFDAGDVDAYEFGVIARNLVDGDGYSYLSVTPTGVVEGYVPGAFHLPGAFMPPAYVALVVAATVLARALALGPEGLVWLVRTFNIVFAAAGLLAVFALVHGHAHGAEMGGHAASLFAAGFVVATALLHAAGIALGLGVGTAGAGPRRGGDEPARAGAAARRVAPARDGGGF